MKSIYTKPGGARESFMPGMGGLKIIYTKLKLIYTTPVSLKIIYTRPGRLKNNLCQARDA